MRFQHNARHSTKQALREIAEGEVVSVQVPTDLADFEETPAEATDEEARAAIADIVEKLTAAGVFEG